MKALSLSKGSTGFVEDSIEWVLKPGGFYMFRFTNLEITSATFVQVAIDWYEEYAG